MTHRKAAYWATTGFAALALAATGAADVLRVPAIMESLAHLGYPTYFATILGTVAPQARRWAGRATNSIHRRVSPTPVMALLDLVARSSTIALLAAMTLVLARDLRRVASARGPM
jgi:hypothetical protein